MLELGLGAAVRAQAAGPSGAVLHGPGGAELSYGGLTAIDAVGHRLDATLTPAAGRLIIHVDTAGATYPVRVDPFIELSRFGEPQSALDVGLGSGGLAISGDTVAATVSVNTAGTLDGAVDIFVANPGGFAAGASQVAQITDATPQETFAASLSLTADGQTLAVGAPDALAVGSPGGKVYVFQKPATGWASTTTANAAATLDDVTSAEMGGSLGRSVSISPDGSEIAAGLPNGKDAFLVASGAVDIFDRGAAWTGTDRHPVATVFEKPGGENPGDFFGWSVAISGTTLLVGAIHAAGTLPQTDAPGLAYIFRKVNGAWNPAQTPSILVGAGPSDFFGWSVAISADAKTLAVGGPLNSGSRGAVYVYASPDGNFPATPQPSAVLTAAHANGGDQLGNSVSIDGNAILAGAPGTTVNNTPSVGAAYVFIEPAGGWTDTHEAAEFGAPGGMGGDSFGQTVALSGDNAIVSAPFTSAAGTTNHQGFLFAFGTTPTASIAVSPPAPDGQNGWYVHPVRFAVSASDLIAPVTDIRCTLDPTGPPSSFAALPPGCGFDAPAGGVLSANGAHTLFAAAANSAGGTSPPVSASVRIDTTPPTVTCSSAPTFTLGGPGGVVAATVSDATSGPTSTALVAPADTSSPGTRSVTLTGRDNAGNTATASCPYTVAAPRIPTIPATLSWTDSFHPTFTVFSQLAAHKVPVGATITLKCPLRACRLPARTLTAKATTTVVVCRRVHHRRHCTRRLAPTAGTVNLLPLVKNHHFPVKAQLTVSITMRNMIGTQYLFTVRRAAAPLTSNICLAPGSNLPGRGC
jgi:hypothetical protein